MSARSLFFCLVLATLLLAGCSPAATVQPTHLPPAPTSAPPTHPLPLPTQTPVPTATSTVIPTSPPPTVTPVPAFGQVSGKLTHTFSKEPIAGAELVLLPVLQTSPKPEYGDFIQPSVFTDSQGSFLFEGIPTGKYALFIAPGVQGGGTMWSNPFSGAIVFEVKDGETTELEVTYPGL